MAIADIAINIVTKGAELAKRQLNGVGNSAGKTGGGMQKLAKAGKVAGIALGVALVKGMTEATKEFISFNDKMTQSLAIMNTTTEQQKQMEEQALAVSRTTRISAEQSAEAYFFLASAGLNAEQSISALPQVAKFAQAGMFDMATATDLATDAQSALGLTVDDAQQNLNNLTRVTDVLVKANTLANASVQQFSEALTNKAGAALKVTGKSIEEGVAVLSAFADRGVKGAEAGEKLNQLLRDIPRATAKNSKEFEKLGLQMFNAEGKLKNVADLVEELDGVLGPMSDELKASTLDQLGLNRGVADAVKILSGASTEIRDYETALMDSGGTTEMVADKQMGSLKSQIDLMSNAFSELGILIGDTIAPILISIVGKVTDLVQGFSNFIKKNKELTSEIRKNVEEAENQNQIYGTDLPRSYSLYNSELKTNEELMKDSRTATQRAIDTGLALHNVQNRRITTEDIIADALKKHQEQSQETTQAVEELTEAEIKLAKEREEKSLGALQKVLSAHKKLKSIQENIKDLQSDERKALEKLNKERNAEKGFIARRDFALQKLNEAREESKKVTLEEELAIERQREAIQRLEQQEDRSKVQNLELQIAKQRLTELIEQSTSATSEETQAQREYQRALDELEKQQDKIKKAQEEYRQSQEDLAKATEKSTENLLEMAIAKKALDDAIADAEALGALEEGIKQMVESVGGDLDKLRASFESIFNLKGKKVSFETGNITGGGIDSGVDTGSEIFDSSGNLTGNTGTKTPSFADRTAFTLGQRGGVTTINNIQVAVEGALSDKQNIQDAVAIAVIEAQKRGTKVIL